MNKILLTLGVIVVLLMAATFGSAAPKWVPTVYHDADTQIASTSAVLYDMTIYYNGVTAGDFISLSNEVAVGATDQDDIFYMFVAPAAHGTYYYKPEKALTIDTGLYLDVEVSGGRIGVCLTYQ